MSGQLTIVRGTVTAAKEQMNSVRIDQRSGYGRINTTPQMWLRDERGKEHRYEGDIFEAAQPGHHVAIISRTGSSKPLAFANFTTDVIYDGDELAVSTSASSTLASTFGLSVLLVLPGALVWGTVLNTIGLGDYAFTATGFQIYVLILIGCVYAGITVWSKSYRERADALRDEIDQLLTSEATPASRT